MKTIIAGSRDVTVQEVVDAMKEIDWAVTEVVSGNARGADAGGEYWARKNQIPVKLFPADWNKHGKSAGPIRNRLMAAYAEALVAVWDGESRGTANMIQEAEKRGLRIYVHLVRWLPKNLKGIVPRPEYRTFPIDTSVDR
jgi:predicted Rossmann fold nucleotide-binding protein DprA/Smf involved in DNA uptake